MSHIPSYIQREDIQVDKEPIRYTEHNNPIEFDIDDYFDFENTRPDFQIKQKSGKGDYDEFGLEKHQNYLIGE